MNQLLFFIVKSCSRLPLSVLYGFADLIYFALHYLVGYRRKVIFDNLKNSFPDKTKKKLKQIQKEFYRNFADYLVETLKAFTISPEELAKRHTHSGLEIMEQIRSENKNVLLMAGHVFNWEWFIGTALILPTPQNIAVYHRLRNAFWDKKMCELRARYRTTTVEMRSVIRHMLKTPNDGNTTYLLIADQSPKKHEIHYALHFLHQQTPVFSGFDKLLTKKDFAVVYAKTTKIKRGYYHTEFIRIPPQAERFIEREAVDKFYQLLEQTIQENPSNWLWSHKRWKHA
ncbi:lysophospholipid acyltransferase family protein [Vaginella massiliensis]|uniref:lysophospholipid acyltransferase family protein n=1 Tax=Vaginella massiliensis TaxID=1816680 RepID=UPI00375158C2